MIQEEQNAKQNIEQFLNKRGLTIRHLTEFCPKIGDDECLLFSGSVAEGLANTKSDIDLLYLGEDNLVGRFTLDISGVLSMDVTHTANGDEVNIERVTNADVVHLKEDFLPAIGSILEPRISKRISFLLDPMRLQVLHRIRVSNVISGHHRKQQLFEELSLQHLPLYLAALGLQDYLNAREDVEGELLEGHVESAIWMARFVAVRRLLSALLAAVDITVINEKWHMQLLIENEGILGKDIVAGVQEFLIVESAITNENVIQKMLELEEISLALIFNRFPNLYRAVKAFSMRVRYYKPKKEVN